MQKKYEVTESRRWKADTAAMEKVWEKTAKEKSPRQEWNKKKILRNASLTIIPWFEHVDVLESMKTETENIARLWKMVSVDM